MDKLAYTYDEAAEAVGLTVYKIREHVRNGRIVAKKDGKTPIIQAGELRRFVDDLPAA